MRHRTLAIVLVLGLVLGAATTALAQAGQGAAAERQQAARERRENLTAAREAILDAFRANRTAVLDAYHASLNATRASFLENKSLVLERCNQTRQQFANNSASNGTAPDHASCVQDGLQPLIEKARAENKAARELAQEKLREERQKGLSAWAKTLREANERYRQRTGDAAPGA